MQPYVAMTCRCAELISCRHHYSVKDAGSIARSGTAFQIKPGKNDIQEPVMVNACFLFIEETELYSHDCEY